MSTATISASIAGTKLYQKRAREALPLLVRQALAGHPIYYANLAAELRMPNPRNLNYVLGSIGQTLRNLSIEWNEQVPPIQSLVVNRNTDLPGEGIGWFLVKEQDYAGLPKQKQQAIVDAHLKDIYAYPYWLKVLDALALAPAEVLLEKVELPTFGGSGEGPEHKALKAYVSTHPEVVGLRSSAAPGKTEEPLLSGDFLDVSFVDRHEWVAVEVKSHISSQADIHRGLFQCVKYGAVMKAQSQALGRDLAVRAVLVLGAPMPEQLLSLKNMLGIEVIHCAVPR